MKEQNQIKQPEARPALSELGTLFVARTFKTPLGNPIAPEQLITAVPAPRRMIEEVILERKLP